MNRLSTTSTQLAPVIAGYADRFHAAAGDQQHVASPLCAWMLLAICGRAVMGRDREILEAALGMDPAKAGRAAARLIDAPHPAFLAAFAVWTKPMNATSAFKNFLTELPVSTDRGPVPTRAQANEWMHRVSKGLIVSFHGNVDPPPDVLLASAIASRVRWAEPFQMVPAAQLGPRSPWAAKVKNVLKAPSSASVSHTQGIVSTRHAGDVAMHSALSRDGLLVTSVIAAPDVPAGAVLAAAHEIAHAHASRMLVTRSLYEMPTGDGHSWTILERQITTNAEDPNPEFFTAILPQWEAYGDHTLDKGKLGFDLAASSLAQCIGLPTAKVVAMQSATARYARLGFETGAAATALVFGSTAAAPGRKTKVREAILRFGHPYAVVASVSDMPQWDMEQHKMIGTRPWTGLPVFSAWITEPHEVTG